MELDHYIAGITQRGGPSSDIETDMRRARKILDAAKAIKGMCDRADRLARRVDAFEASQTKTYVKPPDPAAPLAATS